MIGYFRLENAELCKLTVFNIKQITLRCHFRRFNWQSANRWLLPSCVSLGITLFGYIILYRLVVGANLFEFIVCLCILFFIPLHNDNSLSVLICLKSYVFSLSSRCPVVGHKDIIIVKHGAHVVTATNAYSRYAAGKL